MMCPICGIEMRVGRTNVREEDGKKITEQDLVCRSPQCPNYKTVLKPLKSKLIKASERVLFSYTKTNHSHE